MLNDEASGMVDGSASDAKDGGTDRAVDGGQSDGDLSQILRETRTLAVVGIKNVETEDAFRVPRYMQAHGYSIVPVNPKLDRVLDQQAHPDLPAVQTAGIEIDLVNLFRASENIPAHVDEILDMSPLPKAVWMQLGIHHGPSAARLRAAGIRVVQDRCIMVDHRRLTPRESVDAGNDA